MGVLQRVSDYSNSQLQKLFFNALRIRENKATTALKRQEATQLIGAISQEWSNRIQAAEGAAPSSDFPEKGMLATLGYHVGHSGEKRQMRRAILEYLMTEQLPLVDNPVYTAEWGEPLSRKRLEKFCRTLEALISQKKHWKGMGLAIADWEEDLEWVQSNFGNECK